MAAPMPKGRWWALAAAGPRELRGLTASHQGSAVPPEMGGRSDDPAGSDPGLPQEDVLAPELGGPSEEWREHKNDTLWG